ncbi:uncharacterized protein V1510DRAFT_321989 [Dipodascopsis tothii]|uniref:uncharacterized protein n=1 Tax=Dipodascopsis tothii TaxID=44089 RepID=UPI0034CDB5FB
MKAIATPPVVSRCSCRRTGTRCSPASVCRCLHTPADEAVPTAGRAAASCRGRRHRARPGRPPLAGRGGCDCRPLFRHRWRLRASPANLAALVGWRLWRVFLARRILCAFINLPIRASRLLLTRRARGLSNRNRTRASMSSADAPDLAALTPQQREVLAELEKVLVTCNKINDNLVRALELTHDESHPGQAANVAKLAAARDSVGGLLRFFDENPLPTIASAPPAANPSPADP